MCIADTIRQAVNTSKGGEVFFVSDFSRAGNEVYVSRFMSEMVADKKLERLGNGIYYKPIVTRFGVVRPSIDKVVESIARRDKAQVMPTGQTSEYLLGLSTQVPMNYVYLTSGSARRINVGKTSVIFKRSVPKNFAYKSAFMSSLVQAMKSIGEKNLTDRHRAQIAELIEKHADMTTFYEDLKLAPIWIKKTLLQIVKEGQKNE